MTASHVSETTPAPLGARYDGGGASFALFSSVADAVELCLFDEAGVETSLSAHRRGRRLGR